MIRSLSLENFRSIRRQTVHFHPYTVVVGPNAAGKSNLFSALVFLNHLVTYGLESAALYQRGWASIANRRVWLERPNERPQTRLAVELETPIRLHVNLENPVGDSPPEAHKVHYEVSISLEKEAGENAGLLRLTPTSVQERVVFAELQNMPHAQSSSHEITITQETVLPHGHGGPVNVQIQVTRGRELLPDPQREVIEVVPPLDRQQFFSPYELLIGRLTLMAPDLFTAIRGIALFDLQPLWMHVASQPVPYPQLNPYGVNLAQRLDQILKEETSRQEFESLLRMVVPWLGNLTVWRQPDHSFLLAGEEQFMAKAPQVPMESYTLSDGTLYAMALIDALHFEDFPMKLLEEPERYLHPALFPVLAEWMEEVTDAQNKLLVTTHSPDLVAALPRAHWDHILYASRTSDGDTCYEAVDPSADRWPMLLESLKDIRVMQRMDAWHHLLH